MSIRVRFTLALTAVGVVLFGTYALWAYQGRAARFEAAVNAEIRVIGESLATSLGNAFRDQQLRDVEETLATLEAIAPDLDVQILDPGGGQMVYSRGAVSDPVVARLAARAAAARTEAVTFDPPDDPRRVIFTGPLRADDGSVLGSLAVSRPTQELVEDLARTRNRLVLALVAFVVATMFAGMILGTIHLTLPLGRLLDGVRQIREGDFRARVRPRRNDEIGKLVDEFNAMIGALARMREQIESEVEARSRLEIGLQRVDKLVTIGQLSAGLAHEIGSPLQVLSGRASTLQEHADPEVRRQAGSLVAECERITRVVEQLLSFGRRKPMAVGPCDLVVPVVAVIDLLGGEARRRKVTLELDTRDGPHAIIGDVDQLQQVTLNLVRNAMTATPAGGTITVRVDRVGDVVRLVVRDTGPGIDPETQARLFEPFFTTRASDGGTGLGLAVVRAITNQHHARIDVRSVLGRGAEFVVSFPHLRESARA